MSRRAKVSAVILAAAFLSTAGTYGYFSDTIKVTNHISTGDVNIGLTELTKKGGTEVAYENPQTILPGAVLSKIPRITNYAVPCWVRAKIVFKNQDSGLEGLDDAMISGFSSKWVKRGEYYYCKEILKKRESVDLFQTVSVPAEWTEAHNGQKLGITVQAEAIQAANFQPDFSAMSPWGNQKIQKCVHEEDGVFSCKVQNTELSVEFNGDANRLMAVPGDFFTNMGTAMPGDLFEDTVAVLNTTEKEAEIFFKTCVEGQNSGQLEFLREIGLTVELNGKQVYQGSLDSQALEKVHSLGKYKPGEKGELKFSVEVPKEWDNAYALRNAAVQWIFSVNAEESTDDFSKTSDKENISGEAAAKDTGKKEALSVKTGDRSDGELTFLILLGSGSAILSVGIYRKRRRKS